MNHNKYECIYIRVFDASQIHTVTFSLFIVLDVPTAKRTTQNTRTLRLFSPSFSPSWSSATRSTSSFGFWNQVLWQPKRLPFEVVALEDSFPSSDQPQIVEVTIILLDKLQTGQRLVVYRFGSLD